MEFVMNAVFHYAKDSEKYIRHFQEKRPDYAARDLYHYSAEQLRALLASFKANGTLESDKTICYHSSRKDCIGANAGSPRFI